MKDNVPHNLMQGKIPPSAKDLERAVLGVLMLEPLKLPTVMTIINTEQAFYYSENQIVFKAIKSLYDRGSSPDFLNVTEELFKTGALDKAGGAHNVTDMTTCVTSSASVDQHARIILEKYYARELIKLGHQMAAEAYDPTNDVFDLISKGEIRLAEMLGGIAKQSTIKYKQSVNETLVDLHDRMTNKSELVGLSTGLSNLDTITLGHADTDLIIVAAGTGEGKTTFALQNAHELAKAGIPVLFFSMEMGHKQLMQKNINREMEISLDKLRLGTISQKQYDEIYQRFTQVLIDLPFDVYDKGGLDVEELVAIARMKVARDGVKVIFVDYLQMLNTAKKGTREQEISHIAYRLKALAMELGIPIVALSQLSRIEKGSTRMYRLSDLRESGAIEQAANQVMFFWRPSLHKATSGEFSDLGTVTYKPDDIVITIAKNRLGKTANLIAQWQGYNSAIRDRVTQEEVNAFAYTGKIPNTVISEPSKEAAPDDDLPF